MRRRFRNPGGATSAEAIGVDAGSSAARPATAVLSASAIASGAIRYGRASFIARLLAKSPWPGSAGCSTSTAGRVASSGSGGSDPSAMARSHARPTASRTWVRTGVATSGASGWGFTGPHGSPASGRTAAPSRLSPGCQLEPIARIDERDRSVEPCSHGRHGVVAVEAHLEMRQQDLRSAGAVGQRPDRRPVEMLGARRTGPGPNEHSVRRTSPGRISGSRSSACPQSPE